MALPSRSASVKASGQNVIAHAGRFSAGSPLALRLCIGWLSRKINNRHGIGTLIVNISTYQTLAAHFAKPVVCCVCASERVQSCSPKVSRQENQLRITTIRSEYCPLGLACTTFCD